MRGVGAVVCHYICYGLWHHMAVSRVTILTGVLECHDSMCRIIMTR